MTDPRGLAALPSVADLLHGPERVGELPLPTARDLLPRVMALQTALMLRVLAVPNGHADTDRLLTVHEAAERLGCNVKALYKRRPYPFEVREGKTRRWSEAGLEMWIRRQQRR